jgi:hypothetical protein
MERHARDAHVDGAAQRTALGMAKRGRDTDRADRRDPAEVDLSLEELYSDFLSTGAPLCALSRSPPDPCNGHFDSASGDRTKTGESHVRRFIRLVLRCFQIRSVDGEMPTRPEVVDLQRHFITACGANVDDQLVSKLEASLASDPGRAMTETEKRFTFSLAACVWVNPDMRAELAGMAAADAKVAEAADKHWKELLANGHEEALRKACRWAVESDITKERYPKDAVIDKEQVVEELMHAHKTTSRCQTSSAPLTKGGFTRWALDRLHGAGNALHKAITTWAVVFLLNGCCNAARTPGDTWSVGWFAWITGNTRWGLRAVNKAEAGVAGDTEKDKGLSFTKLSAIRLRCVVDPRAKERLDHQERPLGELQFTQQASPSLAFALPEQQTRMTTQLVTVEQGAQLARYAQGVYLFAFWLYVTANREVPALPAVPSSDFTVLNDGETIHLHLPLAPGLELTEDGWPHMATEYHWALLSYAVSLFTGGTPLEMVETVVSTILSSFSTVLHVSWQVRAALAVADCVVLEPAFLLELSTKGNPQELLTAILPIIEAAERAATLRATSTAWINEPGRLAEDDYLARVAAGRGQRGGRRGPGDGAARGDPASDEEEEEEEEEEDAGLRQRSKRPRTA